MVLSLIKKAAYAWLDDTNILRGKTAAKKLIGCKQPFIDEFCFEIINPSLYTSLTWIFVILVVFRYPSPLLTSWIDIENKNILEFLSTNTKCVRII